MIFSIIAGLVMKLGVGRTAANKAAPFVFVGALAVAIIAAFLIWLHFHDAGVLKADRAETAETALKAERTANTKDAERQIENQANDASTRKAINDAAAKDPDGAKAPAGPAARAAADSLRKRAAGKPAAN